MPIKLIASSFFLFNGFCSLFAQTSPKAILDSAFQQCQIVSSGYYEMTYHLKAIANTDTTQRLFNCHFEKIQGDTLFQAAFHYNQFGDGQYAKSALYTGNELVTYNNDDSTGIIMAKSEWEEAIMDRSHNYLLFSPLTSRKSLPLPGAEDESELIIDWEYLGEGKFAAMDCYRIRQTIFSKDSAVDFRILQMENDFWINKSDFIPVQYTAAVTFLVGTDTLSQFERYSLTNYEFDQFDRANLTLASIPPHIDLKAYQPDTVAQLLPLASAAPDWSLKSLKGETVQLSELKGKVVLVDFFFKSCFPCMQALPFLQSLHEKYADDGLQIIGIDPFDTKEEDGLAVFMAERGVTYPVLFGDSELTTKYRVRGYPTMYLIGKDGNIVFHAVGYDKGEEHKLEEIISQLLE